MNTTDSAVRITHFPTGIVISCQDEKSQTENKAKAMKILKAKIYDLYLKEQNAEISGKRKSQIGSGDRSEKIRTYNFPKAGLRTTGLIILPILLNHSWMVTLIK